MMNCLMATLRLRVARYRYSASNSLLNGSGPSLANSGCASGFDSRPVQAAEAARIVEAQNLPGVDQNIPMIVRARRHIGAEQAQASRHAEMHDQGPAIERDQDVLGAPLDAAHGLMADRSLEIRGDRPAQAAVAHDQLDDAPSSQSGRDAAPGGFYFR